MPASQTSKPRVVFPPFRVLGISLGSMDALSSKRKADEFDAGEALSTPEKRACVMADDKVALQTPELLTSPNWDLEVASTLLQVPEESLGGAASPRSPLHLQEISQPLWSLSSPSTLTQPDESSSPRDLSEPSFTWGHHITSALSQTDENNPREVVPVTNPVRIHPVPMSDLVAVLLHYVSDRHGDNPLDPMTTKVCRLALLYHHRFLKVVAEASIIEEMSLLHAATLVFLATKWLADCPISARTWVGMCGSFLVEKAGPTAAIPVEDLVHWERELLELMDWKLSVGKEEWVMWEHVCQIFGM